MPGWDYYSASTIRIVDKRGAPLYHRGMSARKVPREPGRRPVTAGEYRVLDALWRLGSASVGQIAETLKNKRAYTTVMTVLRVLERKGYVRHTIDGRTYVYAPVLARDQARRDVLNEVTSAFFGGSPKTLMLNLTKDAALDGEVAARIRALLGEDEG
jgi:predicted transcriptional regulator